MKVSKWTIATAVGAALVAFLLFKRRANAAALPEGQGEKPATPAEPVTTVEEVSVTADAVTTEPPGRTSQSTLEVANKGYDGQAAIDAYLRSAQASASRNLATEQTTVTPQAVVDTALAKTGAKGGAALVNALSNDTKAVKQRREAYRGVIKHAASLLQAAGVTGSGCGILTAASNLARDPFGMSVEEMAIVVDTIEDKVSRCISSTRKDATYRTISAMTDPAAISMSLVVQLNKAEADVKQAVSRATAKAGSGTGLIGTKLIDALKASCQPATNSRSTGEATTFTVNVQASNPLTSKTPTFKTGFL